MEESRQHSFLQLILSLVTYNTYPTLVRRYHVHTYLVHPTLKPRHFLLRCRLLLPYRFFSTLKPRLVEHTADVYCCTDFYCGTDGTVYWGGIHQLETRFARIIRYEYSLYVPQSRASRSRCSIPGISGRVDMLTSPVAAARAAVTTGAWVESKHDMYLIHTCKCGSSSLIYFYPSAGG